MGMETKPHLTAVKTETPWSDPRSFRQNLYASLTERERKALDASGYREPVLDRVASALGSERFLFFYFGIIAGCFLTVGFAFVWSVL